jgi:hypothetical protein
MPGPKVTQCGGSGQPACPPDNALVLAPGSEIARAFMDMDHDSRVEAVAQNKDHHHHHFWKAFVDSLGNAIGEAKFGG